MIMMGGSQTELFRWPAAELYLVDRDERALLQRGVFTLFLATHSNSPQLVAVEAIVGEVQWPVGKDCDVSCRESEKVQQYILTFVLQSLVYELVLIERDGYGGTQMVKLQDLLSLYTTFSLQSSGRTEKTLEEAAGKFWLGIAGRILEPVRETPESEDDRVALQLNLAGRHMNRGGMASTSSRGSSADMPGIAGVDENTVQNHRQIMKKMHQARRISAVAKLFSKALMRGAISPDLHTLVVASGGEYGGGKGMQVWPAVADVDLVAKVVDMVERKATLREILVVQQKKRSSVGSMSTWTLNEVGLQLLLKAVVAANRMAVSHAAGAVSHAAGAASALPQQRSPPAPPHTVQYAFLGASNPTTPDQHYQISASPQNNQLG